MTFNDLNLNNALRNALADLELTEPTPIQEQAFSPIMSGRDVVGIAQTGTGKTFAYLLPLLRMLKFSKQKHPRILIIVPTRELVAQIVKQTERLNAYSSFRILGIYGGVNINSQKQEISRGWDIVVATPGRLYDLALSRGIKLKTIQKLVIDEVDEMFNLGFRTQLINILDLLPQRRQSLLFSATLTDEVEELANNFFQLPQKIEVAASGLSLTNISQLGYRIPNVHSKTNLLEFLLNRDADMTKVLVFTPNKKRADWLHEELEKRFPGKVGAIHSNKSQNYRFRAVQKFDDGTHRLLIATDIIARGLDFEEISHVVNFDTPDSPENYVHRIGRTGRAKSEGVAITFINEAEELLLLEIEKLITAKIEIQDVPEGVELSETLTPEEILERQPKVYMKNPTLHKNTDTGGAFHEKKAKNLKVNLAKERRLERKKEKWNSKRRPKNNE